jgi:hypothetical protein
LITSTIIDFNSRECKGGFHYNCHGTWQGMGFEIICDCKCHKKNSEALEKVGKPLANASHISSRENGSDDD